jgi:hypothetical protein
MRHGSTNLTVIRLTTENSVPQLFVANADVLEARCIRALLPPHARACTFRTMRRPVVNLRV